ncbi:hypothetical protein B0H34DRAFT_811318 [Crassisporium funariophilum]|nr:hypothetical protein B0H34DRAFT_811318 [Crassisporium funariophilum]
MNADRKETDAKFAIALFRQDKSLAVTWKFVIHPDSLQDNVWTYGIKRAGKSIDDPWRTKHAPRRLRNMRNLIGVFALQNGRRAKGIFIETYDIYVRENHPADGGDSCDVKPWGSAAWVAGVLIELAKESVIKLPSCCLGSTERLITYVRARRELHMPCRPASGEIPIVALDPKAEFALPEPICISERVAACKDKENPRRNPVQRKERRSSKEGEEDCQSSSNPPTESKRVKERNPLGPVRVHS